MFITNPEIFDKNLYFLFDKEFADALLYNGFALLGIYHQRYMFMKTQELLDFIDTKGGELFGDSRA